MDSGWQVIDLTGLDGKVVLKRGRFCIEKDSETLAEIAFADVASVLLGDAVSISNGALRTLAEHDIVVLHCDWRCVPTSFSISTADHSRIGARQIAQANITLPRKKNAWAQIVKAKILGQCANLSGDAQTSVRVLARNVRSGDPSNVEAQAAKRYWSALFPNTGFRRSPGSGAGQNALLDYGYAVLRGFGVRAVFSAGLSPPLGLHHHNRSNYFALVDDIIEPFRPAVDATVASLECEATLNDQNVKRRVVEGADRVFSGDGYSVSTELTNLAQRLGNYFEGNTDRLEVKTWQGTSNGHKS